MVDFTQDFDKGLLPCAERFHQRLKSAGKWYILIIVMIEKSADKNSTFSHKKTYKSTAKRLTRTSRTTQFSQQATSNKQQATA
ncbi:hypothetical protein [Treponema socranskii]|uniref:hypothetical protein n=1 Tax=Treponema socranskii TaxID=53419 RepID=UPI003D8FC80F